MERKAVGKRIVNDIKEYGMAGVVLALYTVATNRIFHAFCPMVIFAGLPCPGCGMSRATFLLMTGRWGSAWQMNPMIFPVALAAVYFAWNRYVRGRSARGIRPMLIVILILLVASYCFRMYLYFPGRVPYVYYEGNILEKMSMGLYPFFDH